MDQVTVAQDVDGMWGYRVRVPWAGWIIFGEAVTRRGAVRRARRVERRMRRTVAASHRAEDRVGRLFEHR